MKSTHLGGAGTIRTVFGRIGDIVAAIGDYTASQITNTPAGGIAATNVQAAINELDTEKLATNGDGSSLTGLTKTQVGLSNVDNTSDAGKPVSTATQTALNGKQDLDSDLTAIAGLTPSNDDVLQRKSGAWINRTIAQLKTDLGLVKADVGLGNVDNTSDANKPVSTAQQTALDLKLNKAIDDVFDVMLKPQQGLATAGSTSTSLRSTGIYEASFLSTDAVSTPVSIAGIGRGFKHDSSAVIGNDLGSFTSDEPHRMDTPARISAAMSFSAVTNIRLFIGLGVGFTLNNYCGADTLATLGFGIQFSTDRGDTTFQIISWDGTTQNRQSTTVAPAANTLYQFRIRIVSSSQVVIGIYNQAGTLLDSKTITTNLPASTSVLQCGYALEPRTASAISAYLYSWAGVNYGYV